MELGFYNYSENKIINLDEEQQKYPGCYFDRVSKLNTYIGWCQQPEWMVVQKINQNSEGYFDFSKNMIDIGAYIGIYRWSLPFKKGWLFEPNRESYMICHANAVLKHMTQNTYIYNQILSNREELIEFNGEQGCWDGMEGADMKNFADKYAYYKNSTTLLTKTLDDYIGDFENVGFIKIDCEGMEWKILQGASKTLKLFDYPPILFENWMDDETYPSFIHETEEHRANRNYNIRRVLGEYGYNILWNWGDHETHLAMR